MDKVTNHELIGTAILMVVFLFWATWLAIKETKKEKIEITILGDD